MIRSLIWSVTLAVASGTCLADVTARARLKPSDPTWSSQVEAKLKDRSAMGLLKGGIDGPASDECLDAKPCRIDLKVEPIFVGGNFDGCNVKVRALEMIVNHGTSPKLLFVVEAGIIHVDSFKITQKSSGGAYGPRDFDQPGYEHGRRRYRIRAVNERADEFEYKFNLDYVDSAGRIYDCGELDPVIVNRGS